MKSNNIREASGEIKRDPSANAKFGEVIKFSPILIPHKVKNGFYFRPDWNGYGGVLLMIQIARQSTFSNVGSAVIVGPGVAFAAKHVYTEDFNDIETGAAKSIAIAVREDVLQLWKITKIAEIPNSDLLILSLKLQSDFPENNLFHFSYLNTRYPKLSEQLTVVGFRAFQNKYNIEKNAKDKDSYNYAGKTFVSAGNITARYPNGRDSAMLPWPCLEVDCNTVGGMSGGPVFDSEGYLIGILCSSIEGGPSYVSLLWPALIIKSVGAFSGWPSKTLNENVNLLNALNQYWDIPWYIKTRIEKNENGEEIATYEV